MKDEEPDWDEILRAGDETVIRDFCASYDSTCFTCGGEIETGDKAGYIDDDHTASCWDCCEQAKR